MQFNRQRRIFIGSIAAGLSLSCATSLSLAKAKKKAEEPKILPLYNRHTGESLEVMFYDKGKYIDSALAELNYFLRDHREQESTKMDLKIIEQLYRLHRDTRSSQQVQIVSAYRTAKTNNMLRKKSGGVAKRSYHMKGQAVDFYIPDVKLKTLRQTAVTSNRGGVGYYPKSHFIHVDSGPVRNWTR